jgi:hypothetical protein
MDTQYVIALLADEDFNFDVVHDDALTATVARERAYEVQRSHPARRVGIFKLSEVVSVEFSTVLVP